MKTYDLHLEIWEVKKNNIRNLKVNAWNSKISHCGAKAATLL